MIGFGTTGAGAAANVLCPQQCLYFLPLPHGHGSFRPGFRFTFAIAACFAASSYSSGLRLDGVEQPEQCGQPAEVLLIIAPSSDRLRTDLLSYLPFAGCQHAAARLLE